MAFVPHMNVAAILRSDEAVSALRQAATDMNGTQFNFKIGTIHEVGGGGALVDGADVLLIDVNTKDSDELAALGGIIQAHSPRTPIIVTAAEATLQDVRQLMRLGVVDVVPQPITREDLLTALEYASRLQASVATPAANTGGRVISFMKGGGGVGATTIAAQAACILASSSKSDEPVACLLDLDIQFGTAALYLDLAGKVDYHELVDTPERLDGALLKGMMSQHPSGLDVLAAPAEVMPLETLTPDFVAAFIEIARKDYKYILIDQPEAWTNWSFRALQESDTIIIVTQLTVAWVRQARRQLDTMTAQGLGEKSIRLVLNRFEPGWGKSVRVKEAEKALGHNVDYFIVNDYKTVSEAINQGVALSKIRARTKVEKCIRDMIEDSIAVSSGAEARAEPRLG